MLELRDVTKSFGTQTVLRNVSLRVEAGAVTYLLGRSGQGKSVMLRLLLGLLDPDRGEVFVDGLPVSHRTEVERRAARERCGMVFQFPALFDAMTLAENLAFAWQLRGGASREIGPRSVAAMEAVGLERALLPRHPHDLSVAQQKRASLARALLLEPEYFLFDEPTTGLDPEGGWAISRLVADLVRQRHRTALVVSHDVQYALATADRMLVLEGGQWIFDGTPREFLRSENSVVRRFAEEGERRGGVPEKGTSQ